MFEVPEWPRFLGNPGASGLLRSCPSDFVVEEIPRIHPSGEGGHLWLWVEKQSANTDWVAGELARAAGCHRRDVGFAGLKDRHALARQWFSVPYCDALAESAEQAGREGFRILESRRHSRKLKRGTLDGNRFRLVLRDFHGDAGQTEKRLESIRKSGVPNYFGPQRFGHGGSNVERGFDLLSRGTRLPRNKRSIYLSALRSFGFNQVLAERVRGGLWNSVVNGDLLMLDGSHSVFHCERADADIEDRCERHDIHPTGPLPGARGMRPSADAAALEQAVLERWPQLTELLVSQGVKADRRALRLCPAGFEWSFGEAVLELSFVLPPGAYATTVLREILEYTEARPPAAAYKTDQRT